LKSQLTAVKKVYLAGAMEFAKDGGIDWRRGLTEWLLQELGHEVLDPTVLEHDQLTEAERDLIPNLRQKRFDLLRPIARKIVLYDLDLVMNQCDYIVCHWNEATQLGCGTAGEITAAAWKGKSVYMVLDYPREKASTWMVGCTTCIFESWNELKEHLLGQYKELDR
jgi:nucleoside 2-deoxyribosyltransferase